VAEPLVIVAPGELDAGTAPGFRDDVSLLYASGARAVVIDLSGTRFCDSAGIGALIGLAKRAAELDGTLRLRSPSASVATTLRISGAASVLELEQG
jgi:anti-sigma B factor antagonist